LLKQIVPSVGRRRGPDRRLVEADEVAGIESMAGTLTPGTPVSAQVPVNGHSIQRHTGPT
jgi:hypothetical protein